MLDKDRRYIEALEHGCDEDRGRIERLEKAVALLQRDHGQGEGRIAGNDAQDEEGRPSVVRAAGEVGALAFPLD